jgi:GR25 family glycosyltransferase involved in LPS biosynthesis
MNIDKVLYINLDERPDRNAHMMQILSGCPWPVERIQAVRLTKEPSALGIKLAERHRNAPHVASIFLSHKRALNEALKSAGTGSIIILEDDVMISPKVYGQLQDDVFAFPDDGEVLMLSVRYRNKPITKEEIERRFLDRPFMYETVSAKSARVQYIATGAHFYIVRNRDVVVNILEKMDAVPYIEDVDIWMMENTSCYFAHCDYVGTKSSLGSNHNDKIL